MLPYCPPGSGRLSRGQSSYQTAASQGMMHSTRSRHHNFQKPVNQRLSSPACAAFRAGSLEGEVWQHIGY